MADNELLLKINADAKNVKKAFDDVRGQTEDLESSLNDVAKISAIGFAALVAEIGFAVKAFTEATAASSSLEQALQNQGIYTEKLVQDYGDYADAVQAATGIDNDAVTAAQAVAQSYLGQIEITEELTFAIADLAAKKNIDLSSAATIVAKTIGTETNALAREGLQLDATATASERYAKTLEFLQVKVGGQAAASEKATLGIRALGTAFGNAQEEIGKRFAPAVELAARSLTKLIVYFQNSPEIVNFTVALIAAGAAVTALGILVPAAISAFALLKSAMVAAGIAATGTRVAMIALGGATGIGALVFIVTELALHWDAVWSRIKIATVGAVAFISNLFSGLKEVLAGAFTFDVDRVKAGLAQITTAIANAANESNKILSTSAEEQGKKQEETQKSFANKRAAIEAEEQARKKELAQANQELIRLDLENASAAAIELKKQEISTLEAIIKTHNEEEKALLARKLQEINESEANQRQLDIERMQQFVELERQARAQTNTEELQDLTVMQEQKRQAIMASQLTEQEAEQKVLNDTLATKVASNNQRLEEEKRYGVAYAAINKVLRSTEVQGMNQATGELVQLTQSKNATLKSIGKAAAISQIIIKTAQSAMNIYQGFSSIPFVGPALGIAGAAAAIAFGGEQVSNVVSAASGGIITGGIPGVDSVPVMAMPGELVVPTQNFEEVVSSVKTSRAGEQGGSASNGFAHIILELKDEFMDFVETKLVERQALGISLQRTPS